MNPFRQVQGLFGVTWGLLMSREERRGFNDSTCQAVDEVKGCAQGLKEGFRV